MNKSLRQREPSLTGIASAAIQSVLIGVIVFLPKSGSLNFLFTAQQYTQGIMGFLILSVSIALILVSLAIFWNRIEKSKQD